MSATTPPAAGSSHGSLSTSAYMVSSAPDQEYSTGSDEEIASLPSESASESDLDTLSEDYGYSESDAEEEWRESMEQLELLLTMVLVPFVGKYLGRKCAYWSEFASWRGHGLGTGLINDQAGLASCNGNTPSRSS